MSSIRDCFNQLMKRTAMSEAELTALTGNINTAKLSFLMDIVDDLEGGYKPEGIRCWFDRPRAELAGKTPRGVLEQEWTPTDTGPQTIRRMSRSLHG